MPAHRQRGMAPASREALRCLWDAGKREEGERCVWWGVFRGGLFSFSFALPSSFLQANEVFDRSKLVKEQMCVIFTCADKEMKAQANALSFHPSSSASLGFHLLVCTGNSQASCSPGSFPLLLMACFPRWSRLALQRTQLPFSLASFFS